ncbi:MAG: DMT family transporter [Bacteroidia bacterium]|nr:DMT family transporter [Bacteroidia bacterium]
MGQKKGIVYLAVVFAMVFWAFSFVWVKEVYVAYGPLTTVFFRLIIATLLLLIYGWVSKKLLKIEKQDYRTFLLLAFFEPFLYFMGESFGLKYVSSTMGAIIIATIPLFSPIAASRYHGEKLSLRNFIGIILSFIGVGIVVFDDSLNFIASPLGIGLEFLAVFSAIGYTVVLKNLSHKYNATTIITYQNFIGIFFFLPFWLIFESKTLLTTSFNLPAFIAIVKLALFASCFAFILYTYSLKNLGINNANIFINIIPVLTAVFAWYILGEPLTIRKMVGIAVVIAGLFIAQIRMKKFIARLVSIQQNGGR